MKRLLSLTAALLFLATASAAEESVRPDLVREILRRQPEWPGTQVEIPAEVYEAYVRDLTAKPVPPQPPQAAWVHQATYRLVLNGDSARLEAEFDLVYLAEEGAAAIPLLHNALAWAEVTLDGKPAELRQADDGWFTLDPLAVGRHRLTARAPLKPGSEAGLFSAEWRTPPAAWTVGEVESDGAWEVRFSRSPVPIVGDENAGTHGATGLVAGDAVRAEWRRPQPPVRRAARVESEAHVGWTVADGVHQVRAILDLRLWGGEAEMLTLDLPAGADRIEVAGPDVREVQAQGARAQVFLRGPITQRTRLTVSFEVPRPATGRMTLPAFGVSGARSGGGTLGIAGGGGGVILEMESPGLEPTALYDLPGETRGLLAAPPVLAYRLAPGTWEARVDVVALEEFPVRETLVDAALYTVLYRPDGRVMTKVIYEVRNRAQQYMRVELPAGATLVVARVAEQQRNLARGAGSTVYVPLEKSVLTTAGLVSFPVELVYVMPGPPLGREGTLRLPLPRTDLSVAYARCALMLPTGMQVKQWQGPLRQVRSWSSETAELEFEYGRGYLAPAKPMEAPEPKGPGILETIGGLFVRAESKYDAMLLRNREEQRRQQQFQEQMLQAKNRYRAGVDFYDRGDYAKARGQFEQVIQAAPDSTEAENAKKYLENVRVALGEVEEKPGADRGARAAAKAVQRAQQMTNVAMRERQEALLAHARQVARAGRGDDAEAAYQVAVQLGEELELRGEEKREQAAVLREAKEFLSKKQAERGKLQQRVVELEERLAQAKEELAQTGGQEAVELAEVLVEGDERGGVTLDYYYRPPAPQPTGPAQVELGRAIAEQQVAGSQAGVPIPEVAFGVGGGGVVAGAEEAAQLEERLRRLGVVQKKLAGAKDADKPASAIVAEELDLKRKVEERAKALKGQAQQAAALARQGRLAEAEQMMAGLQKEAQATASLEAASGRYEYERLAAEAPEEPVGAPMAVVHGVEAARDLHRQEVKTNVRQLLAEAERRVRQAQTPEDRNTALQFLANAERIVEVNQPVLEDDADGLRNDISSLRADVGGPVTPAPQKKPETEGLWEQARRYQRQGDLEAAIATVDEITRLEPDNASARQWSEDLKALQGRAESLASRPAITYVADAEGAGEDFLEAHAAFRKATEEIQQQKRRQETVQFDVSDLAGDVEGAKDLAGFIGANYDWSLEADLPPGDGKAAVVFSDGNLVVANDPAVVGQVQAVLDRLRANWGQRVPVASRNVYVAGARARSAGVEWVEGANGVRYAVIDEGALRNLMDLEQREGGAPAVSAYYQDAVVGTQALVANAGVVDLARAGDTGNTLDYNDNPVAVGHDEYLVVDNGSYVTAIKAGRMQHWSAEAEPVRFPGVPAVVMVPAVGYTVKFEKTLLEPEDSADLMAMYTWEGEER